MPLKKLGELTVASNQECLADVDRFSGELLQRIPAVCSDLDDIAIAVSEAVNNAMQHGNKLDDSKSVHIAYYLCSSYLRIVVQDEGAGFTPESIPDPRKKENLLKVSGRGVLIIRHLMDRVSFRKLKKGMQIIMDKFCG